MTTANFLPENLKLGLRPDKPDARDHRFGTPIRTSKDFFPPFISLAKHSSRIEDQGDLSSCTGSALTSAYETMVNIKLPKHRGELSRLFVYYNERDMEGSITRDEGATLRSGIKTLKRNGVCLESYWPYLDSLWSKQPTSRAYENAQYRIIDNYERLQLLDDMRYCLYQLKPFVFGIPIFEDTQPEPLNEWTFAETGDRLLGYHAMVCMGYDDRKSRFLVKNSWGTDWGLGGWCYVDYEFMRREALDCWTFDILVRDELPQPEAFNVSWWERLLRLLRVRR